MSEGRIVCAHVMACFTCGLGGSEGEEEGVARQVEAGRNVVVLYSDSPLDERFGPEGAKYADVYRRYLDAAGKAGLTVIPCFAGNWAADPGFANGAGKAAAIEAVVDCCERTLGHSAVYRRGDRPVLGFWDWHEETGEAVRAARGRYGDFACVAYPVNFWLLYGTRRQVDWSNIGELMDRFPEVDGWINFAVANVENDGKWIDHGSARQVEVTLLQNANLVAAAHERGRFAFAGVAAHYRDSFMGLDDFARVTAAAAADGADGIQFTSGNDMNESYIDDVGTIVDERTMRLLDRDYPRLTNYRVRVLPILRRFLQPSPPSPPSSLTIVS